MAWTVSGYLPLDAARLVIGSFNPDHMFSLAQNADPATMRAEVDAAMHKAMPGRNEADIQAAIAAAMGEVAKTYKQAIAANPLWTDAVYTPDFYSASGEPDPNAPPPDNGPSGLWILAGVAAVGVGLIGIGSVTK